jgi:predicted nucleotidyltransferase
MSERTKFPNDEARAGPPRTAAERVDEARVEADPRLRAEVEAHPYPLLFATVSGAHLYGFPSRDSDRDLRGAHLLPLRSVAGMEMGAQTVRLAHVRDGVEVDLVTHEARKFFGLLLRDNGYVLEQLYSPLVVHATPAHEELKEIARGCVTRGCARHYRGFAWTQWTRFEREEPRRVKTLLYVYRVLLTGIHLLRTGEVDASLPRCNAWARLPFLDELVARKREDGEHGVLAAGDVELHRGEVFRLHARLDEAAASSTLPAAATAAPALNDFLLRLRLGDPRDAAA